MADQKESSVLFSLKELMNLEEDRIKKEDDDRKRTEEAENAARADAERRAREEEERRLRAEDERKRGDEARMREETARLEAIRHGEVEKARVEAEGVARMQALRRQQEETSFPVAFDWLRRSGVRLTVPNEFVDRPPREQHTPEAIAIYCLPFTE